MTDYAGFDPASMHGVIIVKPTLLSYSIYLPTTLTIEQTYHLRFSCKELRAISSQRQKALCYSWAVLRDERDNRDKRVLGCFAGREGQQGQEGQFNKAR